ncbi:MAG: serine--tRNA ligase [Candidatus Hydrogenedentota bacterium]|nr:MAG: serine--tRNA ligase [Candidatus Hydrogenedentota bacterium]
MLNPKLLKSEDGIRCIKENLKKRQWDTKDFDFFLEEYYKEKELKQELENLQAQRNQNSKQIGILVREGKQKEADELKAKVKEIGEKIANIKIKINELDDKVKEVLLSLPNILDSSVPEGEDESNNLLVREWGNKPTFDFDPLPHYEIATKHNYIDFERGVKLSGSRFYVYNEEIAKLEREIIRFMLNLHREDGYLERMVPFLVNDESMIGTGQLPKFAEEFYRIEKDALSLIPTAEVPLTNLYRDEILSEKDLPILLTAATPCFRREAGAAGKDTRGIIRVHQFQKVELVILSHPEKSSEHHEALTKQAEKVLQKLNLHYRVMLLCSGDTSAASAKTYDIEVYMPGSKRYVEISSCSNFLDYQARRAKIRYKNSDGKNDYLHTLNGSGVAAGRLVAALMENYQKKDGTIDFEKIYSLIR